MDCSQGESAPGDRQRETDRGRQTEDRGPAVTTAAWVAQVGSRVIIPACEVHEEKKKETKKRRDKHVHDRRDGYRKSRGKTTQK